MIYSYRLIYLTLLCAFLMGFGISANGQDQLNVSLFDNVVLDDVRYSGSWYYEDEMGNEYALIGAKSGTAVIQLEGPGLSTVRGFVTGPSSNWREITVIGDYAYVSTEGDSLAVGLQIIDLSPLPADTAFLLTNYDQTFSTGHIVQRDIYSEAPFVYVIGTDSTEGVHILDVSQPANPVEIGVYDPDYYIHDVHVNGDLMFCAAFFEAQMDVVDISDKANPTLITSIDDPGTNTHSSWLTEDKKYLFICDEADGFFARIFNVENLDDIFEVSQYSANLASLVHNPYILGDYAFISHNTEGLRVVDIADPTCPVEVGYYDTFDGPSGGFSGLWSACPYLPSGKIIGADRTKGLFVWEFNNIKATRINGQVIDEVTGDPIANATVDIPALDTTLVTDADGKYKIAFYPATVTLIISAPGYKDEMEIIDLPTGGNEEITTALSDPLSSTSPESLFSFSVAPNPVKETLHLSFENNSIPAYLIVLDAHGRQLEKFMLNKNVQQQFSVGHLAPANYFLQLPDGSGFSFIKY